VIAFVIEENGFPVAPTILGVVLGTMLEENFVKSMIKSDGDPTVFFTRPIAMWLAIGTFVDHVLAGGRLAVAAGARRAGGLTRSPQARGRGARASPGAAARVEPWPTT
jgi:TctA family transporter